MAGIWNLLSGVGSAAGGYLLAEDMRETGAAAAGQMGDLAGQLQGDSAFKGYGVTTGLGTSTVNPDGSTNLGVGPDAGMMSSADAMYGSAQGGMNAAMSGLQGQSAVNDWMAQGAQQMAPGYNRSMNQMNQMFGASQQAMGNAMQDTGAREQEIYGRAMAMQQPGLDAARASQQAREYAMGRGGVRGSQFGGTAEDAATARAQAQAQNQASFQAMGQAQNEMMNQANMASQFGQMGQGAANANQNAAMQLGQMGMQTKQMTDARYGMMGNLANQAAGMAGNMYQQSYMPMNQQLNAMQVAQNNANMAQTGQLTGAGYGAQLGLGGIQAQINAEKAASELYGNMFGAGMSAIGGIGSTVAGTDGGSWIDWLFGQ